MKTIKEQIAALRKVGYRLPTAQMEAYGVCPRATYVDFESEVAFGMVAFCLKRSIPGEKFQKEGVLGDEDASQLLLLESLSGRLEICKASSHLV